MHGFMFATGIENSYPTIAGGVRIDQMEKCGHYRRWQEDLDLVRELGIHYLRWGPPLLQDLPGAGPLRLGLDRRRPGGDARSGTSSPILDLCHFGVPDWIGNFQNADFPRYFAEYAGACARRYPHVKYWTPVNEILITALFSAKYGWWNEMLTSDEAFVRATINLCRANLLAIAGDPPPRPRRRLHPERVERVHPPLAPRPDPAGRASTTSAASSRST